MTNSYPFKGGKGGMTDEGMQEADRDPKEICEGGLSRMLLSLPMGLLLERESNRLKNE